MRGQYLKELGYNGASLHDAYETVSSIPTSTSDSLHPDPELELELELDLARTRPQTSTSFRYPPPGLENLARRCFADADRLVSSAVPTGLAR